MYLPADPRSGMDDMVEHLPCAVRLVPEVRTITEEAFAVRAAERLTLAPQTVLGGCDARRRTRPGPVRADAKMNQDTTIWLANSGPQPVEVAPDQVVALAEWVSESEGMEQRDDGADTDKVNRLVRRAAQHLTDSEQHQLTAALHPRQHLLAAGKEDLGWTDIVQHRRSSSSKTAGAPLPGGMQGRGA